MTAIRVPTTYASHSYGGTLAVEPLPISGYSYRWSARSLAAPTGSTVQSMPELRSLPGVTTFDMTRVGNSTAPTVARPTASCTLVSSVAGGDRYSLPDATAAVAVLPTTLVWVGIASTQTGTTGTNGSTVCALNDSTAGPTLIYGYTGKFTVTHNGTSLISTVSSVDLLLHVVVVTIATDGTAAITVDGAATTGTLSTAALHRRAFINSERTKFSPGVSTAEFVIYPRVLSSTEIARLTAYLRAINGV